MTEQTPLIKNFIEQQIEKDMAEGMTDIITRFPPEPNGFLHIGHAKSVFLNYGLAEKYNGQFFLRFDDTNPIKEEEEYVQAIQKDVEWLGCHWDGHVRYASDYFDTFYEGAVALIKAGLAYVCDLSADEMREYRGTLTEPGKNSPYRDRSVEENLDLFERMKNGEFPNGARTLRAKIDMASPNLNMRDPAIYRILHASHHRTGDKWCIYPMYDYAHPLEDAIEGVTHSVCTLEFQDHRPLYNWFRDQVGKYISFPSVPQQMEFARLELAHTVTSKRNLKKLVDANLVDGWDDPRMPTISGLRRKGYTKEALKQFCQDIGVGKTNSTVDEAMLLHALRSDLNERAPRAMGVLRPLKIIISNYPEDQIEWVDAEVHPKYPERGLYQLPFGREIYIEEEDFREDANRRYHRLKPGGEVRLKYAYIIKCEEIIKDDEGNVVELICTYDPTTKSGSDTSGKKVKGTIHWVEKTHAVNAEVHLYDELFDLEKDAELDVVERYNPDSLTILKDCKFEPRLKDAQFGEAYQLMRKGYFCLDSKYSTESNLVFNETVNLREGYKP